MKKGYDFDDVLVVPKLSLVCSRDDVDISVRLSDFFTLKFPLLASPMVGVVDGQFAKALSDLGGLAIFHRFYKTYADLKTDIRENLGEKDNFGVALKINQSDFELYFNFWDNIIPKIVLIDTANGYNYDLLKYCEKVKNHITSIGLEKRVLLMAGNVATAQGYDALCNAGCDMVRVGIGGGSPCSTRNVTGIGVPNISALLECSSPDNLFSRNAHIVIDGGIRNSGDFVKAIVAGADLGMAGKLFAECHEAPNNGVLYGMASRMHMEKAKLPIKSVEGFDIPVTKKHSLKQFVTEFGYGIKSAGTYLNSESLIGIYVNGDFIEVGDSAIKKGLG